MQNDLHARAGRVCVGEKGLASFVKNCKKTLVNGPPAKGPAYTERRKRGTWKCVAAEGLTGKIATRASRNICCFAGFLKRGFPALRLLTMTV
jgi:hypothetical protein